VVNSASQATIGVNPSIAYNVSHDNALVAMVSSPNTHNPPAFTIGVDVMKVRIPGRETFAAFVETVGDQVSWYLKDAGMRLMK
jgi:4'-phosphopantetheinyl transferase